MNDQTLPDPDAAPPALGAIGLHNFPPYLMNRIMGRYNASLRSDLAALGLTTPKMRALAVLSVLDGLQIGQLAVYTVTDPSTLSRSLDQLEGDGLVRRMPDEVDGRATRLHLTDEGRAAFGRLWPAMAGSYARMFAGIPAEEQAAFTATLAKILRNIRHHEF